MLRAMPGKGGAAFFARRRFPGRLPTAPSIRSPSSIGDCPSGLRSSSRRAASHWSLERAQTTTCSVQAALCPSRGFAPPSRDREALMPCLARLFAGLGEGEIRQHENRKLRGGRLADVRAAVLSRPLDRGWVIYTGLPLAEHLAAAGDCLRTFTDASNLTERVASADKAEIVDTM